MSALLPAVKTYVESRMGEFGSIAHTRRPELMGLARYVEGQLKAGRPADLTFICTHNSRRSHMAQIWAQTAATHFKLAGVRTFSGGTEATAFNERAVRAIRNAGCLVEENDRERNPRYLVRFSGDADPIVCYSKRYDDRPNPQRDFCAVMTCSQADEACPVVFGASRRISIPYEDPKEYDGTEEEHQKYEERCAEIAREMIYVFSHVDVGSKGE